jgi:hypothetical protein
MSKFASLAAMWVPIPCKWLMAEGGEVMRIVAIDKIWGRITLIFVQQQTNHFIKPC